MLDLGTRCTQTAGIRDLFSTIQDADSPLVATGLTAAIGGDPGASITSPPVVSIQTSERTWGVDLEGSHAHVAVHPASMQLSNFCDRAGNCATGAATATTLPLCDIQPP